MCVTQIRGSSGKNIHGFTIIEIIASLVVIGILTAGAVSISSSTDSYRLSSEVAILKSHLRYAQSRAMSDTVSWGIAFSGNSYTLQRSGITTTSILPNDDSSTHNLQGGVTSSTDNVTFDNFGNPGVATTTITLTAGSDSQIITITANTGFIP